MAQPVSFARRALKQGAYAALDRVAASGDPALASSAAFRGEGLDQRAASSMRKTSAPPAAPAKLEHVAWSYFKACVIAFVTGMMLWTTFVLGKGDTSLLTRLHYHLATGGMMLTVAPALLIPIRFLVDAMKTLQVPRGWSDMLIGGLCGSLMMLPDLQTHGYPRPMSICFVLGGVFGGFYYWRRRGYPDLTRGQRAIAELVFGFFRRLRSRSVI